MAHLKLRDAQSITVYCITDGLVTVSVMDWVMRPFWFCMSSMYNKHSRRDSQKAVVNWNKKQTCGKTCVQMTPSPFQSEPIRKKTCLNTDKKIKDTNFVFIDDVRPAFFEQSKMYQSSKLLPSVPW